MVTPLFFFPSELKELTADREHKTELNEGSLFSAFGLFCYFCFCFFFPALSACSVIYLLRDPRH